MQTRGYLVGRVPQGMYGSGEMVFVLVGVQMGSRWAGVEGDN